MKTAKPPFQIISQACYPALLQGLVSGIALLFSSLGSQLFCPGLAIETRLLGMDESPQPRPVGPSVPIMQKGVRCAKTGQSKTCVIHPQDGGVATQHVSEFEYAACPGVLSTSTTTSELGRSSASSCYCLEGASRALLGVSYPAAASSCEATLSCCWLTVLMALKLQSA